MSSYMRSVERKKVRTQMEKQDVPKPGKKLKVWFDEYRKKKHEYLEKKKLKEQQNG